MNIALATLVLVILLLPGAITLRAYYTSFKEKQAARHIPFNELIFRGLFISFILHWSAIVFLSWFNIHVDYNLLYKVIIGKDLLEKPEIITTQFSKFGCYILCLCGLCFSVTKGFKRIILNKKLDLDISSLAIKNYWYYIFSADYLESQGVQGEAGKTDIIVVDVLTENDVIYSGYLIDFNYSSVKDELENIVIRGAQKQKLRIKHEDYSNTKETHSIPGDIMVIPSSKIKNFNIYYLALEIPPDSV